MLYAGEIAALFTALCWSLTSIAFTISSKRVGALQVNLFRLPLALILLLVTYLITAGDFSITLQASLWLAASGIVGLAIGDTFLFQAMILIGARLSMVLLALAPPITALLAYLFLNETISLIGITGIFITVTGVVWVVAEQKPEFPGKSKRISLRGMFFGFLAAVGQAVGLILAKKGLETDIHALLATLIRMLGATVILLPLTLPFGKIKNPISLFKKDHIALKWLLVGVILGPYLGVTFSLVSIKYTHTGIAATLMSTMPVLMLPFVIWIEKEKISFRAVLGAMVTVVGIAILFQH